MRTQGRKARKAAEDLRLRNGAWEMGLPSSPNIDNPFQGQSVTNKRNTVEMEKFDKAKLKKTETQEKNPLPSKGTTGHVKPAGESQ
ncbi:thymosin beta-4-like [Microtus oregoni]|uniref:thymosin beta-4-like n=1 Tax=Microtus oregoni TaxID=111838 RepID=UPI001BB0E217|nr:thymosin beta-4-like [Microtus oregoni]